MAYTYPGAAPALTESLTAVQIHHLLKNPTLLARRLQSLAQYRFLADFLLAGRFKAVGGAILYPNGDQMFTIDDPEAIGAGGSYPRTSIAENILSIAKTTKWGRDVEIFDEAISRMLLNPVNKALAVLVNSMVKHVDQVAMGVISSRVTRTKAASASWAGLTAGDQIVEDVLMAVAETEELEEGYNIDTVVLKPTQFAKVRARLIAADLLSREAKNPITGDTATGAFDYMDLTWATSNHTPFTDPLLLDRQQLGGMADEDISSPGYSVVEGGIEVKTIRDDDRDGYKVRARRITVPVVTDPQAGVRITGTGI